MQGNPFLPMKTTAVIFGLICLFAGSLLAAEKPANPQAHRRFKIIQTANAIYPTRMMMEGVSNGVARAVLHVDSEGKLVDSLVVAYTRLAFAEEVQRVLKKWKFEPETSAGEPVDTIVEVTFNFEVNGVLLVQRFGPELSTVEIDRGYEYQACNLKHLDGIPTPVSIVHPTYPMEWAERGLVGKVTVDFYIDETGKVRFAAAPFDANPLLSGIAVAAVSKWQFAPPTRKGRPVLVHAQQIFDFRKEKTPVAEGP